MARINGVNSDYIKQGDGIIEVDPRPANLEMKLFICPHEQNSALEAENNICIGEDSACPNPGPKTGHAMVQLSQNNGIRMMAGDDNLLQVHQGSGSIEMSPASGQVQVNGAIRLVANGHTITIVPSASGISMTHTNGASVEFKPNGDLDLNTKNSSGTVNIQGNLVVSGTVTRQGQII